MPVPKCLARLVAAEELKMLAVLERTLEQYGGAGTVVCILAVLCGILVLSNIMHAYLAVRWRREAMLWKRRYLDLEELVGGPGRSSRA
jgi:hypothetical protein